MSRPPTSTTSLRSTRIPQSAEHAAPGPRPAPDTASPDRSRGCRRCRRCASRPTRRARVDASRVRRHPAVVLGEVAGERDDVGRQRADAIEDAEDVVVVDPRADVQIAELHERAAGQRRRQIGDRQRALDELDPVRLDAPRVEAGRRRRAPRSIRGPSRGSAGGRGSPFLRPHVARRDAQLAQQRRHVLDHRRRSAQVAHRFFGRQRALQGLDGDPAADAVPGRRRPGRSRRGAAGSGRGAPGVRARRGRRARPGTRAL